MRQQAIARVRDGLKMQNWSQWQLSAGAVATPMPQPPVGYAAPGADPMAMMQAYMQYYNQPVSILLHIYFYIIQ